VAQFLSAASQDKLISAIESRFVSGDKLLSKKLLAFVKVDRTTWFRWKTHRARLSMKRAQQLCDATGIPPEAFLSGLDADEEAVLRPVKKYDYILAGYQKYRKAELRPQYDALLVETAVLVQELCARNDIFTDLVSNLTKDGLNLNIVCRESGSLVFRVLFSHGDTPIVKVFQGNATLPVGMFHLGDQGFYALIKFLLRIERIFQSTHANSVTSFENMGARLATKMN
jgi:hypothetical protein